MRETDTMVVGRWKREAEREVEGGVGAGRGGNTFQLAGLGIAIGIGSSF